MTTAMVTGGTSGIGAAFARALAARGHDLVLVARDSERLASTAAELTSQHRIAVETMTADLGEHSDVEKVAARLADPNAPIDRLVNNAGFGIRTRLTAEDLSPHEHGIDVMIRAVLLLSGAAARTMKARGDGSIINISSTAGFVTMGSYSATKAWVTIYTEGLATELTGIGGAGHRGLSRLGADRVPPAGRDRRLRHSRPDVARCRRGGGPGATGQRPRQGDLHPLPAVRGDDVRRPARATVPDPYGFGPTLLRPTLRFLRPSTFNTRAAT